MYSFHCLSDFRSWNPKCKLQLLWEELTVTLKPGNKTIGIEKSMRNKSQSFFVLT